MDFYDTVGGELFSGLAKASKNPGYRQLSRAFRSKVRDLISLGGILTFTMPGSSTRCARKSSLNATWQKYEQAAQPRAMAG